MTEQKYLGFTSLNISVYKTIPIYFYILSLLSITYAMEIDLEYAKRCPTSYVLAINDALNTFQGKWKMPIIGVLLFGKKRFREISREITKITPRMLSQELKDLEVNGIITRTVYPTTPVTVEYELTPSGQRLHTVLEAMIEWGLQHRQTNIVGMTTKAEEVRKSA